MVGRVQGNVGCGRTLHVLQRQRGEEEERFDWSQASRKLDPLGFDTRSIDVEELLEVEVDEVVVGAAKEREAEAIAVADVIDAGVGPVAGLGHERGVATQRGWARQREEAGQLEGAAPGAAHLPAGVRDRPAHTQARAPLDVERLWIVGAQAGLDHQRAGVDGGRGERAGRGAREPVVAGDVAAEERWEEQRALALAALAIELRAE